MFIAIEPIPCLSDNYCYLITHGGSDAWLVDPSELEPVAKVIDERGLLLHGILLTHHHWDHVGGVVGLLDRYQKPDHDIWVAGHASDRGRIERQTHFIDAPLGEFIGTGLYIGDSELFGMHIPGHTTGALAWLLPDEPAAHCFTGDTLFAAGCGRLFEGTPSDMYGSLRSICALPAGTQLWFGHEYTAANLHFAQSVEPDNDDVALLAETLPACTTPTTVGQEWATNPFLRSVDAEELGERRAAKDSFRS